MQPLRTLVLSVAAFVFVGVFCVAIARAQQTTADGVYTDAQATRGQAVYVEQCQACHGANLAGGLGPPLSGAVFLSAWDTLSLADLVDKIQHTMPAVKPGTLSRAQATDLVAHLLKANAFPTGPGELRGDDSLAQVALVGLGAPSANPVARGSDVRPPGNLAQVMRGILFPSSNLIFNVQNADPGEQTVGWQPGTTPFGWADWGAGIYSGWELVDYAAIALAESAPLLLAANRRCENGKPVPVEREDWVRFTADLVDAGRAAYRASQTRSRDAVIEVTNRIADACLLCHEAYRDKPGGTTIDPSNKAARCVS
jgi:mono/diheme cytochrome c family protein